MQQWGGGGPWLYGDPTDPDQIQIPCHVGGCAWLLQNGAMHVLLAAGVNVNHQSRTGYTAFHSLAINMDETAVALLLAAGADPKLPSFNLETPLREAVLRGHMGVVKALLDAGCPPDTRDDMKVRHYIQVITSTCYHHPAASLEHAAGKICGVLAAAPISFVIPHRLWKFVSSTHNSLASIH